LVIAMPKCAEDLAPADFTERLFLVNFNCLCRWPGVGVFHIRRVTTTGRRRAGRDKLSTYRDIRYTSLSGHALHFLK